MKTDTKQRILAYIKEKNEVSAKDIIAYCQFSPQAVFKHLKKLQATKEIFKVGKPPAVRYYVYGNNMVPKALQIKNAFIWARGSAPVDPPSEYHCPSSDIWQGRFSQVAPTIIRKKFAAGVASLIGGAIGEIGDNCFAHNAPNWVDVRGCWFEWEMKENILHCVIADRGRGIFTSLKRVRPNLQTDSEALLTALTERVTGRAPEQRGNGLKFSMSVLGQLARGSFVLQSGNARFECSLPLDQSKIKALITESPNNIRGTYAEFNIILPYEN